MMDDEEYRRMIERKKQLVRFSKIKPGEERLDRRMTIFDPSDPNNAHQSIKFLQKLPLRQRAFTRKITSKSSTKLGEVDEGDSCADSNDGDYNRSLIEAEGPDEEIFMERNICQILRVNLRQRIQEGNDVI